MDVSRFQVPSQVNWHRARELGYSFAYIRITSGTNRDPAAEEHLRRAREAGFIVGGYAFMKPTLGAGPQFEAIVSAHRHLGLGAGDLVPCVDVESWTYAGVELRASPLWAAPVADLLWLLRNRYGDAYRYHNVADWQLMGKPDALLTFPLWLADHSGPADIPDWSHWQHAPALIPGVYPTPIDWSEARELARIEDGPLLPGPPPVIYPTPENVAALAADIAREGIR